ncbi:MAG: HEAT repeat domain-containing protein [Gemmatimonadota bacterium]
MSEAATPSTLPVAQVEELIKSMTKALRAFQMYLPNNPIYQKAHANIIQAFKPVWEAMDELILSIAETDFVWEEATVYHQANKNDSLAWTLYKDGMRVLTLKTGAEVEEMARFLEVVQRARMLPADADDDLNTLLWEQQFQFIEYRFNEFLSDAALIEYTGEHQRGGTPDVVQSQVQEEVSEAQSSAATEGAGRTGIVDMEDFDSTLYFLDEAEIAYIVKALEAEYSQDFRSSTLSILLDLLELQVDEEIRAELFGILEVLMPNLLNAGEFRSVATILREVRVIGDRAKGLTDPQRDRLENFRSQLSAPVVLTQLLQAVDEATAAPSADDLGELFRELRPGSLETILVWLPKINAPTVRDLLVEASERLADGSPSEMLRLLGLSDSEALGGTVDLCGRLKLQGSVPGLGFTIGHTSRDIRLASVKALVEIGTAGALGTIEKALDDEDREVRITAVRALGARGYKNALKRIQNAVLNRGLKEADLTERIAFFEAYAMIAGPTSLDPLARILLPSGIFRRKETAESRACAAIALSRLGTPEARDVLQQAKDDKELVVRNAVNRALRESVSIRNPTR